MRAEVPDHLVPAEADLRTEYAELREDVRHAGGRVDTARSFGVAAVGALLTLAVQQRQGVIALAGVVLAYLFALVDLVNGFRYEQRSRRAREVELAIDAYEEFHRRGGDERSTARLETALGKLDKRPFQTELNEPGRHAMAFAHPRPVFAYLYPSLICASALLAIWLQARNGPLGETIAVAVAALLLCALCLPRFLDPTRFPIARRGAGADLLAGIPVSAFVIASIVFIALALFIALPALGTPDRQGPGSIEVGLVPRARDVAVRLALAPTCGTGPAHLEVSWRGRVRELTVRLPENFEIPGGRHTVTIDHPTSSTAVALKAHSAATEAGRCTLALPGLVDSGQASRGVTRMRLAAADQMALEGAPSIALARLGPCTSAPAEPVTDCSGLLRLSQSGSSGQRLWRIAGGMVSLLFALAAGLYICLPRARRPRARRRRHTQT